VTNTYPDVGVIAKGEPNMNAAGYRTEVKRVLELLNGYFGNLGPTLPWSLNRSAAWATTNGTMTPTVFQVAAHLDKKKEFEQIFRCYVDCGQADPLKRDTPAYGHCFLIARSPKDGLAIFEKSLACFGCSTTGKLTEAAIANLLKVLERFQVGQTCPECKGSGWKEYRMRSSRLGRMVWLEQYQAPVAPEHLADYETKGALWTQELERLAIENKATPKTTKRRSAAKVPTKKATTRKA
jgi:hypothetical protein